MASLTVNAGTGVNDNSVGTLAWSDLNLISSANGDTAGNNCGYTLSATASQASNRLRVPFDLSALPAGCTITGIGAMIRRGVYSQFSRSFVDTAVRLLIGDVIVGSNKGGAVTIVGSTTVTYTDTVYGGDGDLWGTGDGEITRATLLAATNLIAYQGTSGSGGGSTYDLIDHVTLTVYYTAGGGGLAGGGLAGGGGLVNGGLVTCS